MCLKKYDIYNIAPNAKAESRLRHKKWGFGKNYIDEEADILLCDQAWKENRSILYPVENIYFVPTSKILFHIKKYRSKRRFLPSWWIDDTLGRRLNKEEKWNFLVDSMTKYGWDNLQPACVRISGVKKPIVINGHHRIAVAHHLHIDKIPINFLYK